MLKRLAITGGRRCGRTYRLRVAAAMRQLSEAIEKHRHTLHPDDVRDEPANFASWISACETYRSAAEIRALIDHLAPALESARRSAGDDPRSARLVDMRAPYLDYAKSALERRFPDPQPYERDEEGYLAHVRGGAQ